MGIADLKPGAAVTGIFFLRDLRERRTKSGNTYLALVLSDRSGTIDARLWDWPHSPGRPSRALNRRSFVKVTGEVEAYRGRRQIRVREIVAVDPKEVNQEDFIPVSYRDLEELAGYIDYFTSEIYDPDYSRLLGSFFGDEEFTRRFRLAPGAVRSHHAYLGGLLEHTVSVATLCQHVTVQHPRLDADLLVAAALLHDIGKIEEFTLNGSIGYSEEGRLLGHVLIGQRMIEERISRLEGFPRDKELKLLHAVISHHGELEWGAPKKPQSAEALVLHHIDNLDAKTKGYLEIVEGRGDVSWPELKNYFRRPLGEPMAADREA